MRQETTKMQKQELGFCGPGLMGAPMIRHLLRAGHAVRVWNRTPAKAEALVADGAQVAATPPGLTRELAARAAALGVGWVDAPVSGGVAGAQAGSLAVMAGGAAEDIGAI